MRSSAISRGWTRVGSPRRRPLHKAMLFQKGTIFSVRRFPNAVNSFMVNADLTKSESRIFGGRTNGYADHGRWLDHVVYQHAAGRHDDTFWFDEEELAGYTALLVDVMRERSRRQGQDPLVESTMAATIAVRRRSCCRRPHNADQLDKRCLRLAANRSGQLDPDQLRQGGISAWRRHECEPGLATSPSTLFPRGSSPTLSSTRSGWRSGTLSWATVTDQHHRHQRCAGGGGRHQCRRPGGRVRGQPGQHAVPGRRLGDRQRADQRHRRRRPARPRPWPRSTARRRTSAWRWPAPTAR